MKSFSLFIFSLFIICNLSAQDSLQHPSNSDSPWSFSFSSGYAFQFGNDYAMHGSIEHYYQDRRHTSVKTKSTFGQGIFSMFTTTLHVINPIGFDFGGFSKLGTDRLVSQAISEMPGGVTSNMEINYRFNNQGMLFGLSIGGPIKKFDFHIAYDAMFGFGANGLMILKETRSDGSYNENYTWKYYGRTNLGLLFHIKAGHEVGKRVVVGADGFLIRDKYSPGKGSLEKFDINGVDQRSIVLFQKVTYIDPTTYPSGGYTPGQQSRPTFSLDAVGISLFLGYHF